MACCTAGSTAQVGQLALGGTLIVSTPLVISQYEEHLAEFYPGRRWLRFKGLHNHCIATGWRSPQSQ